MATTEGKKWVELKQVGVGAGTVIGLLLLLQSQGIDLISKSQQANNNVIIEKTIANASRIEKLESSVLNLNVKIDAGFSSLQRQLKEDTNRLHETFMVGMQDRFTKSEHLVYRQENQTRIQRVEDRIRELESRYMGK